MPTPRGKKRRSPTSGYSSSTYDDRPFNRPSLEEKRVNRGRKMLSLMSSNGAYRPKAIPVYTIPSGTGPFRRTATLNPSRVTRAPSLRKGASRSRTARRK